MNNCKIMTKLGFSIWAYKILEFLFYNVALEFIMYNPL